ncbi:MAG: hypothetical protein Q8P08_01825 [bacterium]|nr:hypothetical protein [bacterium]
MAREALIRKKAVEILEKEGFVYWYPAKVKFQQNDIFGVFDLVCWQKRTTKIKFLQLTSLSNFSARKKKVKEFLRKNRFPQKVLVKIEVWGWNQGKKEFRREEV